MYHRVALVASGLSSLEGLRVLDLACGRGGGLAFLAEHFGIRQATGVDLCPRQISFANDTYKDFSKCPISFLIGDIETTKPLLSSQEPFDMVLCIESWHTLPFPGKALRQISEGIISANGRVIIADGFLSERLA